MRTSLRAAPLLALFLAPLAHAFDGGVPDAAAPAAETAPAPAGDAPPPELTARDRAAFDQALADYFSGDARSAAPALHAYLQAAPQTDENRAWAQLFLAKSLADLGLSHAAVVFLNQVARERSNPAALPRALEELRILSERPHDKRLVEEQVFQTLDLSFLPPETADVAHYQQGVLDLKGGASRWAEIHFLKLTPGTAAESRARFAVVVAKLSDPKADSPKLEAEFLALSADEKLSDETRREAMLAVARLRYERKDYPGALDAYGKVKLPPLDPGRATLYLEEAWTRYQLGELHAAFGILTTLEAPSFRDEFLPEKFLLRAFVYRDLCHYLPAKRAAKELSRRFADSLEAIERREDLRTDLRLSRAALSRGEAKRTRQFQDALDRETQRLASLSGSFGERLHGYLYKLYDLSRAEAQRVADEALVEGTRQEADKLLRAAEQARLMEYEVGLKLYQRVKKGDRLVQAPKELVLEDGQVAFRFDGEYWNDELRDFRFELPSRCLEETP